MYRIGSINGDSEGPRTGINTFSVSELYNMGDLLGGRKNGTGVGRFYLSYGREREPRRCGLNFRDERRAHNGPGSVEHGLP